MKREQVAFLVAGVVLGFVSGFVVAWGITNADDARPTLPATQAPRSSMPSAAPADGGVDSQASMARVQERIGSLNQRLAEDPNDSAALVELATIYMEVAMYPQAREYLQRAVELDGSDAHARKHLGVVLGQMGDLEGAREQFEAVVSAQPEEWQGWFYLAVTTVRQHDHERADEAIARLETLNPGLPELAELKEHAADHP